MGSEALDEISATLMVVIDRSVLAGQLIRSTGAAAPEGPVGPYHAQRRGLFGGARLAAEI